MSKKTKKEHKELSFKKPLVIVEWEDITSYSGWRQDDATIFGNVMPISVGFLMSQGKDYVVLAMTDIPEDGTVGDVLSIPTSVIKKMYTITGADNRGF